MEKKKISLQITILLAFASSLIGFFLWDFKLQKGWLNLFIITIKPYFLIIGVLFFIPPFINLISQIFSNDNKKYSPGDYDKISKLILHLSFIIISIYLLGFLYSLSLVGLLILYSNIKFALTLPTTTILVSIFVIDALCLKHFKRHWYNLKY